MKKNHIHLLIGLLLMTFSINITHCSIIDIIFSLRKINEDCDFLHWCASNLECRDYRCTGEGEEDNQVAWTPKGPKCDSFHKCLKCQKCKMHRCQTPNAIIPASNIPLNLTITCPE